MRTDTKTNVPGTTSTRDEQKKFTGYEYDASTDLNYAQNRYYNQNIGQFTSPDPVSINLGTRKSEILSGKSTPELLSDPQSLNSYSYARNNPLRYTDPLGLWYLEASGSGKFFGFGATTGVRVGDQGLDWFVSSGPTVGVEADVSATFSSASQPTGHQITSSTNARFGLIGVAGFSREGEYDPENPESSLVGNGKTPSNSYSIGFGAGGAISKEMGVTVPVFSWGSRKNQTQQSKNRSSPSQPKSTPHKTPVNTTQKSSFNFSSNLPLMVYHNGVTYIRNSSGLLNIKSQ